MIQIKHAADLELFAQKVDVLYRIQTISLVIWDKHPANRAIVEGSLKGPALPLISVDFKEDLPKAIPPAPVRAVLIFDAEHPKVADALKIWSKAARSGDQAIGILSSMDRDVVVRLAQMGMTGVLVRPFSGDQFRQKLNELVGYPTDQELAVL
jgi:hypothetical protein